MSRLVDDTWEKLKQLFDPEIPVSIVDLGLIYEIREIPPGSICIKMTVTSVYCPAAAFLPRQVEEATRQIPGVGEVKVDVVYTPAWSRERICDIALIQFILEYHRPLTESLRHYKKDQYGSSDDFHCSC